MQDLRITRKAIDVWSAVVKVDAAKGHVNLEH